MSSPTDPPIVTGPDWPDEMLRCAVGPNSFRIRAPSSNVDTLAFDATAGVLVASFRNGSLYSYKDVPAGAFWEIAKAAEANESIGRAFRTWIAALYEYEKKSP